MPFQLSIQQQQSTGGTQLYRVSTTPGNTGNLLEFCWCSWKKFITSRFSGPLGLKWEFWGVKWGKEWFNVEPQ